MKYKKNFKGGPLKIRGGPENLFGSWEERSLGFTEKRKTCHQSHHIKKSALKCLKFCANFRDQVNNGLFS